MNFVLQPVSELPVGDSIEQSASRSGARDGGDVASDRSTPSFCFEIDGDNASLDSNPQESTAAASAEEEEQYNGGSFEGPEKTLEVVFRTGTGAKEGLRSLTRPQLDRLCTLAKCTILSSISSGYMDAYVLSESSLFVYRHRFIMKTCGTTTLLRCLSTLLEFADALGMELTWVGYSRKNLNFPNAQLWPHSNFGQEINYIDSHSKLQERLRGSGYILGPVTGDHWFVYVADLDPQMIQLGASLGNESGEGSASRTSPVPSPPSSSPVASSSPVNGESVRAVAAPLTRSVNSSNEPSMERTINMMMFDMAPEVGEIFYKKNCQTGREMTIKSGIAHLCPGATIDETAFTPCGYSMNAVLHDAYYTIHITPEPQCSYVSFETNTCLRTYTALIRNVLGVFRPKRFVLTMFGDEEGIRSIPELPFDSKSIFLPGNGSYNRTSLSSTKVESDLCCMMACYSFSEFKSLPSRVPSSSELAEFTSAPVSLEAVTPRARGYSLF